MLLRTDPFREIERITDSLLRTAGTAGASAGWSSGASWMAMDASRHGDVVTVELDLPGIDPSTIELTVERNELRVAARRERSEQEGRQWLVQERPTGTTERRLWIGDTLDTEHLDAEYVNGVLVLRIPMRESAKPRRVEVRASESQTAVGSGS
jgi:HSP20 family protein